jgi:hypothetical protein
MVVRIVNTHNPVNEGFGLEFPHCGNCQGCGAHDIYTRMRNMGRTYFFTITGVQIGIGQVEVSVQMGNFPVGCSRNMTLALTHVTDQCLACEAFHDPARKGKPITGYVQIR